MRIAICLSGQPRTWRKCHQNWLENLCHLDADYDFFFHFWDHNTLPRQVLGKMMDMGKELEDVLLTDDEKQEILDVLKPKNHLFQPAIDHSDFYKTQYPISFWTIPQFYSMARCAQLKRKHELISGITYDIVIRLRSDLWFQGKVDLRPELETNTVYTVMPHWDQQFDVFRIADIFFYADSATYDQAARFYNHMSSIEATDVVQKDGELVWPPEVALYYYFKSVGLRTTWTSTFMKVMRTNEYMDVKGGLDGYETI